MSETTTIPPVKMHYDQVTDGWSYIFGDNFHWGYFNSPDETLSQATDNLIDILSKFGTIPQKSEILDIGCGIGGPAFYLHEKLACSVTGITISRRGADLAEKANEEKGYSSHIRFMVADILGDFSPPRRFDVIWIMEVTHLITDKERLFKRCFELLKEGGELLLCDVTIKNDLSAFDILRHGRNLATLERTFGKTKSETLAYYGKEIQRAGFSNTEVIDISQNVRPTIDRWRKNINQHYDKISSCMSKEIIDNFLISCDILDGLYKENLFGYGLAKATKPFQRKISPF